MTNHEVYEFTKLLCEAPEDQVGPSARAIFERWINAPPTPEQVTQVRNHLSTYSLASDFVISALVTYEGVVRRNPNVKSV